MFGLGVAVATPFATTAVIFTFPAVFAVLGGLHQDSRYRRGMGGTLDPEYDASTSTLPFVALATGAQSWQDFGAEMKIINAACGLVRAANSRVPLRALMHLLVCL